MPQGVPLKPKWESRHQEQTIRRWMKSGLILREGETYKGIYSFVMSIDNCNQCSVKFNDENYNDKRCMDHDHKTRFFRQVLCHKCNRQFDRETQKINSTNTSGWRWISHMNRANNRIYYQYTREGFKRKSSVSLTKIIAYSFIQLLKKPI